MKMFFKCFFILCAIILQSTDDYCFSQNCSTFFNNVTIKLQSLPAKKPLNKFDKIDIWDTVNYELNFKTLVPQINRYHITECLKDSGIIKFLINYNNNLDKKIFLKQSNFKWVNDSILSILLYRSDFRQIIQDNFEIQQIVCQFKDNYFNTQIYNSKKTLIKDKLDSLIIITHKTKNANDTIKNIRTNKNYEIQINKNDNISIFSKLSLLFKVKYYINFQNSDRSSEKELKSNEETKLFGDKVGTLFAYSNVSPTFTLFIKIYNNLNTDSSLIWSDNITFTKKDSLRMLKFTKDFDLTKDVWKTNAPIKISTSSSLPQNENIKIDTNYKLMLCIWKSNIPSIDMRQMYDKKSHLGIIKSITLEAIPLSIGDTGFFINSILSTLQNRTDEYFKGIYQGLLNGNEYRCSLIQFYQDDLVFKDYSCDRFDFSIVYDLPHKIKEKIKPKIIQSMDSHDFVYNTFDDYNKTKIAYYGNIDFKLQIDTMLLNEIRKEEPLFKGIYCKYRINNGTPIKFEINRNTTIQPSVNDTSLSFELLYRIKKQDEISADIEEKSFKSFDVLLFKIGEKIYLTAKPINSRAPRKIIFSRIPDEPTFLNTNIKGENLEMKTFRQKEMDSCYIKSDDEQMDKYLNSERFLFSLQVSRKTESDNLEKIIKGNDQDWIILRESKNLHNVEDFMRIYNFDEFQPYRVVIKFIGDNIDKNDPEIGNMTGLIAIFRVQKHRVILLSSTTISPTLQIVAYSNQQVFNIAQGLAVTYSLPWTPNKPSTRFFIDMFVNPGFVVNYTPTTDSTSNLKYSVWGFGLKYGIAWGIFEFGWTMRINKKPLYYFGINVLKLIDVGTIWSKHGNKYYW